MWLNDEGFHSVVVWQAMQLVAPTGTCVGALPVALLPLWQVVQFVAAVKVLWSTFAADHKVVSAFFTLVPLLVPVPFLILAVLVCMVQTLVFCLLTMVYIQGAVAHEGHGDEGHGHGDEDHAEAHH